MTRKPRLLERAWQAGFCLGGGRFIPDLIRSAVVDRSVDIADEGNCLVYRA